MVLGMLEKLLLLAGGLTTHACGVGCASAAGVEMWLRSMGNELYRTAERSPPNERPISSAMEVDEDDADAIELLLSISERVSSSAPQTALVGAVEVEATAGGAAGPEG